LDLLSARYADDGHDLKGGRMPTHSDVVRLNLEYYRKQAKALLKSGKAGDLNAFDFIPLSLSRMEPRNLLSRPLLCMTRS
jgi:hypothetical protein